MACNYLFRFLAAARDLVTSEEQLELVMITAVFLAAKASECPARIRDVINVFWKIRRATQEVPSLDAVSCKLLVCCGCFREEEEMTKKCCILCFVFVSLYILG